MNNYPSGEYHQGEDVAPGPPVGSRGTFYWADVREGLLDIAKGYEGKVQLVYMDPPFMTGNQFKYRQKAGEKGFVEHIAYSDQWVGGKEYYLNFMKRVFEHVYDLLTPEGSFYLHVDYRTSAYLRIILDGIFGEENFLNEIIWHYRSGGRARRHFSRKHDNILFYRKSSEHFFNIEAVGQERGTEKRNNMKREVDHKGRVFWSIKSGGKVYRYYEDSKIYPSDVWTDISHLHQRDPERIGYDTQKPEALLERIILSSSRPGDLVADFFAGSGTSLSVAAKLGRKWLGMDSSPHSMHVCRKRLLDLDTGRDFAIYYGGGIGPADKAKLVAERYENGFSGDDNASEGSNIIKITDYMPADINKIQIQGNVSRALRGLEYIDYWAVGYIKGNLYYPIKWARRMDGQSVVNNSIVLNGSVDQDMVIHVVDIAGDQHFYKFT
ncbi:MAG TPA: site-specific DNA-methyltransferase [Clostridia bacterium]|nr:site-specific DNA-methyltransferase [Clostridia bacterium]